MDDVKIAGTYSNSNENVAKQLSKMTTENIKMRLILFHFVLGFRYSKKKISRNRISPNVIIDNLFFKKSGSICVELVFICTVIFLSLFFTLFLRTWLKMNPYNLTWFPTETIY